MKKLIFILFFQFLFSQTIPVEIDLEKSFISYDGKHPAHNWTGISKEIKAVFSFDSKNSNRDSNMLDVIEEYFYPSVGFISSSIIKQKDQYYINGMIFFHGIQKEVRIPVDFIIDNDTIIVDTSFNISLSDYNIKRPSLLTIKMNDKIKIIFHLVGKI